MQGQGCVIVQRRQAARPAAARGRKAYKFLKVPAKADGGQAPGGGAARLRSSWSRTMVRKSLGDAPACLVKKREK